MIKYDTYYNFSGQSISQNTEIILDQYCNGINVINVGTSVCYLNGIPLAPSSTGIPNTIGDSYSVGGNRGEYLQGRVNITFDNGQGSAIVVQKFYLPKC